MQNNGISSVCFLSQHFFRKILFFIEKYKLIFSFATLCTIKNYRISLFREHYLYILLRSYTINKNRITTNWLLENIVSVDYFERISELDSKICHSGHSMLVVQCFPPHLLRFWCNLTQELILAPNRQGQIISEIPAMISKLQGFNIMSGLRSIEKETKISRIILKCLCSFSTCLSVTILECIANF